VARTALSLLLLLAGLLGLPAPQAAAEERPVRIVALGDSLTAGLGLPRDLAFPARLAKALGAQGLMVEISNAGVSGETMSDGLARLDWSVPEGTDAVILELGANDMLRGLDPRVTRKALQDILRRLEERHIAVLVCGMLAARNLGEDYARAFDAIFAELAAAHHDLLYPFFLAGVAGDRTLNQVDGLHPNPAGVDAIVGRILPKVEELVAEARQRRN
jgi:acyl-CoA thioesterase-1